MSPRYKGHGITSYSNLTYTLSTNYEVSMHTINMSFHINSQPSILSHAKLITNSLVPTHNIHSNAYPVPLYNTSMNQPIKQQITSMKWKVAITQARSRSSWESSLRWEECSHSSCRPSLRRDCDSTPGKICELSLKRGGLAWARQFVAEKYSPSPGRALKQKPGRVPAILAWARWARLGEYISSPHCSTHIQLVTHS